MRFFAIGLMCLTMIFFTCLDTEAKFLGRTLPTVEVVWARYFGAGLYALFYTRAFTRPAVMRSSRPLLQTLRSFLLLGSTVANFVALHYLQLAETSTINFLTPMAVALLAGPILGERVGGARIAAIVMGFVGVVVATRPGSAAFQPVVLVSIAGVFCNAGYAIATRMVSAHDSSATTLVWTQFAGMAALTPLLPWIWVTPADAKVWLLLATMGLFAVIGHALLIEAHQRAPAAALTPFNYTQLIWMTVSGMVVFGDRPPFATLIGAVIVVACGLFLMAYERRNRSDYGA